MKQISILIISFLILNISAYSQEIDIFNVPDLSQFKVEQLTTAQINQLKSGMQEKHITIETLESIATAKGMSAANFSILKNKLQNESQLSNVENGSNIINRPIDLSVDLKNNPTITVSKIFGSEIFTNPSLTFEPNSNMATPVNYILGTGDELQTVIYGIQEFASASTISKEGKLNIPNVGFINVSGMTLESAISLIKNACGRVFTTLRSGQSNISVTLSKIRTIKVTIIGSKKAGNYSVSSLSTVFNALYLAGGPDVNGTFRNIELIRGNKVIRKIDIYKFLTIGDQSDNISLKDNDIIRIPTYDCRVSIEGEVKRTGIYELTPNENFNDLLKYCSGFNESAYLSTIKLIQNTDKELKIIDLTKNEYNNYVPKSGDVFKVGVLLNRFENRISIKGSVFRPDDYSFTPGLKLVDLIKKADGLKEDAYKQSAQITRLKDDFSKEIISVNLDKAFSGDTTNNILLKKDDEIIVFSMFDFKDLKNISIQGQVRNPGLYPYLDKISLFDVIIQAGGLSDNASKNIEISRLIKKDEILKEQAEIAKIITLNGEEILKDQSKNFILEPNDLIFVRRMPIFENQQTITISGYVEYPGQYTISNKNERILDLITRAGGLKSEAYTGGIYIKRGEYKIPLNYDKILKKPNSLENIKAQPGDELIISKYIPAIRIVGSVSLNTEIPYIKGKGVKYYIHAAGGFGEKSWKKKTFNLYTNGSAGRTRNFFLFKVYPKVLPGTIINVPVKPIKEKRATSEIVGIASVSTSIATMIAVLSQLFK